MATKIISLCVLLISLSACGVNIEVAQPIPTATPVSGFLNPTIWDGEVVRTQATPRIVFSDSNSANIELFMRENQDAYVLFNRTLYLPLYFNVTWYGGTQSTAQITMNVFRRENTEDAWVLVDSDSKTVSTVETPMLIEDGLGVGVYTETNGIFYVKAQINIIVQTEGGETITRENNNEFTVNVMSEPEQAFNPDDFISSPFGELNAENMLIDYRGWYNPCFVIEWSGDDGSNDGFVEACRGWENQDFDLMLSALEQAGENADWDGFRGFAESNRGLIYVQQGDYDRATIAFASARDAFFASNSLSDFTYSLHNLMTCYLMRGDMDNANTAYFSLEEIREQFTDETGDKLTQANMGFRYEDWGMMDDAYWYFQDKGMPQANVIGFWLNR
jgi:tetratricopeptide (TPR) repeat protein